MWAGCPSVSTSQRLISSMMVGLLMNSLVYWELTDGLVLANKVSKTEGYEVYLESFPGVEPTAEMIF